jgi:hypothetical protein
MAKKRNTKPRRPSPGRDISKEDKIAIAKKVCELYATDKYNLMTCLEKSGIKSFSTWHVWRTQIEEIDELYTVAMQQKNAQYKVRLLERGKTSLERWVDGYDYEETKIVKEKAKNGKLVVKAQITTKKVRHSLQATLYVLNNFDKVNFQKNPKIEKGEETGFPFTGFRFVPLTGDPIKTDE